MSAQKRDTARDSWLTVKPIRPQGEFMSDHMECGIPGSANPVGRGLGRKQPVRLRRTGKPAIPAMRRSPIRHKSPCGRIGLRVKPRVLPCRVSGLNISKVRSPLGILIECTALHYRPWRGPRRPGTPCWGLCIGAAPGHTCPPEGPATGTPGADRPAPFAEEPPPMPHCPEA